MDRIQPYLKSTQIFDCPSNPATEFPSYAYSTNISNFKYGAAASLSSIVGASQKVLLTHQPLWAYSYMNRYDYYRMATYTNPAGGTSPSGAYGADSYKLGQQLFRHFDGDVILFADGHAKYSARGKADHLVCADQSPAERNSVISGTVAYNKEGTSCGFWDPKAEPPSN